MINVMARALMASAMTVAAALVADDCGKGSPPADGGGGDPRGIAALATVTPEMQGPAAVINALDR